MNSNKKIKILIVLDYLEYGGGTRMSQDLTHLYPEADFYLLAGDIGLNRALLKEFNCKKIFKYNLPLLSNFWLYLFNIILSFINLFRVHREVKFDLILLGFPYSALGVILNPLSWLKKKIYILHGITYLEKLFEKNSSTASLVKISEKKPSTLFFNFKNSLDYLIQKICLVLSDKIVVFSNYAKAALTSYFNQPEKKVVKILPPIKLVVAGFKKKANILKDLNINNPQVTKFLIPSRLEPRKGIPILIEAIKILKKKNIHNFLLIVSGPDFSIESSYEIFRLCKENNLFDRIRFIPVLERSKLFELYQVVDCVIMPSIGLETLGMTTLESLYFSTPVIGFNTGATPEILKNINTNLIVNQVTANDLAAKIKWFSDLSKKEKKIIRLKSKAVAKKLTDTGKFRQQFSDCIKNI